MRSTVNPPSTEADPPLGPLIRQHRLRRSLRLGYTAVMLIGIVGTVVLFTLALWRWSFAYRHYGPAVVLRWTLPYAIAGLASSALGLYGFWQSRRHRNLTVGVHPSGLSVRQGGEEASLNWDQIHSIFTTSVRYSPLSFVRGWRTTLTLHSRAGSTFQFTERLSGFHELAASVKRYVYPPRLAECRQRLKRDLPVSFGPITLTARGLQLKGRWRAWKQVESVTLERGLFEVRLRGEPRGSRLRIPVRRIPNVDLCYQLVRHFATHQGPDAGEAGVGQPVSAGGSPP